jgi:L-fuculose-phosphate aldolase
MTSGLLLDSVAVDAVCEAGRELVERRLVTGTTGNASVRCGGSMAITPSRVRCSEVQPADVVCVRIGDGAIETAGGVPSLEQAVHLAVYRARPDVQAIVHTHSAHATAWSFLEEPLGPPTEEMTYYDIGGVPTAPPAPAGSRLLADGAVRALGRGRALLLGRHGVLAVGRTPREAVDIAEAVEHQAQVAWLLRGAGVSRA